MNRHQVILTPEQVQLSRHKRIAGVLCGIDHDEIVAGVGVTPGPLVRTGDILQRQFVKAERPPQQRDLGFTGIADVEPELAGAVSQQLSEAVDGDLRRRFRSQDSTMSLMVPMVPPRGFVG